MLVKYDVPGPRYTSYPTVPYWETSPSEDQWVEHIGQALDRAEAEKMGAAFYMHIPFCEKLCTFCGCTKTITQDHSKANPYIQAVLQEWELYRQRLGRSRPVTLSELHLGGGTPTFLSPSELEQLVGGLLGTVRLADHYELSIEANPNVTSRDHLKALYEMGFRRLSFGIQDFDPKVQYAINRIQSEECVTALHDAARDIGFNSINYDLVYGLPFQTLTSVTRTIDIVRQHRPGRIAFYAYAHVPWVSKSQRMFTEEDLPAGNEKRELYEVGRKMLEEIGYCEVGMDHFALPDDSLWKAVENKTLHRNFMGYMSQKVFPMIGLGMSSIGDSGTAFAQNLKTLPEYYESIEAGRLPVFRGHILTDEDLVLRDHILRLMTRMETDWSHETEQTPYLETVQGKVEEFVQDGLLEWKEQGCLITDEGRAFLRNICMAFDARLSRKAPGTQLFSRTI
jgi:oxygen-independent coproporphyrinogen-3 oxidase